MVTLETQTDFRLAEFLEVGTAGVEASGGSTHGDCVDGRTRKIDECVLVFREKMAARRSAFTRDAHCQQRAGRVRHDT